METKKSALYAWGGPGTIRLLQTKYFQPKIDTQSFQSLYDPDTLDLFQERFGTTDMFVTYSWGFSDKTEQEDRLFLRNKLKHFQKRNIATYAYVQGLNLVYPEWKQADLFCKGPKGQVLFYSKDRAFTCPNNPLATHILEKRVAQAALEDVTGVFVDNILFGLPPAFIYENHTSFFGCSCRYCQKAFQKMYGFALPCGKKNSKQVIQDYLRFRNKTTEQLLQRLSAIARAKKKLFGINLYDPWWHTPDYFYGYDFATVEPYLDYYLIENLALTKKRIKNGHLHKHLIDSSKPTFVVSYYQGIGREPAYTQHIYDRIYTDSQHLGYIPCYKATEFTTDGVWHALKPEFYRTPEFVSLKQTYCLAKQKELDSVSVFQRPLLSILNSLYTWIIEVVHTKKMAARVVLHSPIYTRALKKRRIYE